MTRVFSEKLYLALLFKRYLAANQSNKLNKGPETAINAETSGAAGGCVTYPGTKNKNGEPINFSNTPNPKKPYDA